MRFLSSGLGRSGLGRPALGVLASATLLAAAPAASADAGVPSPPPPTTDTVIAEQCTKLDTKCQRGAFTVSKSHVIGSDFDFDTGWLPKDGAVQVRLYAYLHGRTRVDMSGTIDATWPDPIRLRPEGMKGTGLLATDDGFVVKAQGRFKVEVAGKEYSWTGDLPGVPGVDLSAVSSVPFDPWAWKGGGLAPKVSGKTKQIELAKVPLTDSLIPIPGIEGGFQLEGQGEFSASYVSLSIAFDELVAKGTIPDVDPTRAFTQVLFSSSPSLDTSLFIHGELERQMTLHFVPGFYFEILGKKFDLELVDIPVALPKTVKTWDFDEVKVHFPLPRIEAKPTPIDLGEISVGKTTEILATLFDTGEAALVVDAEDPNGILAIETKHLEIGGGLSDSLRASITPSVAGPIESKIVLESNDPAAPKIEIQVKAVAVAGDVTPAGDDGATEAAGSCGCRVAGEPRDALWAFALMAGLIGVAARRRVRR